MSRVCVCVCVKGSWLGRQVPGLRLEPALRPQRTRKTEVCVCACVCVCVCAQTRACSIFISVPRHPESEIHNVSYLTSGYPCSMLLIFGFTPTSSPPVTDRHTHAHIPPAYTFKQTCNLHKTLTVQLSRKSCTADKGLCGRNVLSQLSTTHLLRLMLTIYFYDQLFSDQHCNASLNTKQWSERMCAHW